MSCFTTCPYKEGTESDNRYPVQVAIESFTTCPYKEGTERMMDVQEGSNVILFHHMSLQRGN